MNIPKNISGIKNVSFTGHEKTLDKTGYELHNFYYLYDPEKYTCELEMYNIKRDRAGNIAIQTPEKPQKIIPVKGYGIDIDMTEMPEITSKTGFAYRFKLKDKSTGEITYAFDNGSVAGIFDNNKDNKYNIVLNNRAVINKNGPMQLIMPDGYYPGIENCQGKPKLNEGMRAKALASVRTHANKLGGNFYGIIQRLDEIEKEGVKRIVGTPYTKDTISSHKYWTQNAYQVSPEFGSIEDFKKLQTELFKHDINWISDAALVNEGLSGLHVSELLRKGKDSFSQNMFRADERPILGIIPDNCKYTRLKIINAPFVVKNDGSFEEKNSKYNPSKPTYIQFYDDRLASEKQKKSDSPMDLTTYDNKNTDNIYDITKHDDAVYPVPIEVDPYELTRNAKRILKSKSKVDLSDVNTMKEMTDFTNFCVQNKSNAGSIEVWDGNVDIPKLNFYRNISDDARFSKLNADERKNAIEKFDRGALAVRDYAVNSGKYWTKLTSDTLLEYLSSQFKGKNITTDDYYNAIKKLVTEGKLPKNTLKVIDKEVIENVLDDNYNLRRLDDADMRSEINTEGYGNEYKVSDYILRQAMDMPLETLPFSTNLLGVITSPYISKKANTENELGVSRYDISKAGNPDLPYEYSKVYEQSEDLYYDLIEPFIEDVLSGMDISEGDNVSDLGKYIISEITPDLTKYLYIKALNPKADIKINENGEFDFSHIDESEYTIQALGIPYNGMSLEEESQIVIDALKNGMNAIIKSEKEVSVLKKAVKSRFENRTLNDFKISEMIIDRLEGGLGWRIDASKDIASIDSVRSNSESMANAWKNVINFWKKYNETVREINPHSYTTAEITDLSELFSPEIKTIFTSDADAERKFIEETGITSVANYNYFFSLLPDIYAPLLLEDFDDNSGWQASQENNKNILKKMDEGWGENPGFLFQSPEDGVNNSYTFVSNHDKPRIFHLLSLDAGLYKTNFASKEHKEIAAKILNQPVSSIDYDKLSSKAVAMGSRLYDAFDEILPEGNLKTEINKAIGELTTGKFKGKTFDAEAFGTRPVNIAIRSVIEQVEYNGVKIPNRDELEAQAFMNIIEPAYDRYLSILKLLTVLPGSPTDFAGDKVGLSGAEEKAKNYHQQNRNIIPWEWLSKNSDNLYSRISSLYDKANEISNLRNIPELSALNNGTTVTVPVMKEVVSKEKENSTELQRNENMQGILRYNDEGSVIIALTDSKGANSPLNKKMDRKNGQKVSRIYLNPEITTAKQGLKHGIKAGTVFKNIRKEDTSDYVISKSAYGYYLARRNANGQELPIQIKPEDLNTLILYKV